jgi:8-oxo-dGTP diphosphatase
MEIEVVAGALFDERGRVLIARRPEGKELAGRWEFPGGKLIEPETPFDGLVRELREELGVIVCEAQRLLRYSHDYPERRVWLDMWVVTAWSGQAEGLDGQALRWVPVPALSAEDILEADQPIIDALLREHSAGRMPT